MGKLIFRRETHARRLARKHVRQHVHPYFGWGRSGLFYDVHPRYVHIRSKVFDDPEQAKWWAAEHPQGTHYSVYPSFSGGALRWALRGQKRERLPDGYRAALYRYEGPPFRHSGVTWEAEHAQRRADLQAARRWLGRGSYQTHGAGGKGWRKETRRRLRARQRQVMHQLLRGDLDAADCALLEPRASYLYDFW